MMVRVKAVPMAPIAGVANPSVRTLGAVIDHVGMALQQTTLISGKVLDRIKVTLPNGASVESGGHGVMLVRDPNGPVGPSYVPVSDQAMLSAKLRDNIKAALASEEGGEVVVTKGEAEWIRNLAQQLVAIANERAATSG